MPYNIQHLIARLTEQRNREGLSQSDLGKKLGLPQSFISAVESGRRDLRLSNFVELARGLGLEVVLIPVGMVQAVDVITGVQSPRVQALYAEPREEEEDAEID
ncbi:MAG TPA: helix-turn-helix transcriptional regulator [Planktothrix sp.]